MAQSISRGERGPGRLQATAQGKSIKGKAEGRTLLSGLGEGKKERFITREESQREREREEGA